MAGIADDASGFDVFYGDNVDFTGNATPAATMLTNGQLLIGATSGRHIQVGTLTSPLGTVSIGYSSPNITIDITGGATAIEKVNVDTTTGGGTNPVVPSAGAITITGGQYATGTFGTRVITINSAAANSLTVEAQISSAVASTLITKNGLSHFDSSQFTVDANGFVHINSAPSSITINGDTGSATGGTLAFNGLPQAGSSVSFSATGTTVLLNTTDAGQNTLIGLTAGNSTLSGTVNTGVGWAALNALTTGNNNTALGRTALASNQSGVSNLALGSGSLFSIVSTSSNTACGTSALTLATGTGSTAIGHDALQFVTSGSENIAIGHNAAVNYTSTEASNIIIGNTGTLADSNVIRIGTQGSGSAQQNKCFIAGITGVSVSNLNVVTINTSTGQLGSEALTVPIWVDVTGASQTIAVNTYYLSDRAGAVAFTLPASATIGDVFRIVGVQGSWTLAQAAGQQIKFGSAATTVGVTGSLASTNAGDCINCVATNTSASTVWRVMSSMGNITVA